MICTPSVGAVTFYVDDNYTGNKKALKQPVLPSLFKSRKGKTGMPFQTEVSLNLAEVEQPMRLVVEAGFSNVFVGIEAPNRASPEECRKFQKMGRDLVDSARRTGRAGAELRGYFSIGRDYSPWQLPGHATASISGV